MYVSYTEIMMKGKPEAGCASAETEILNLSLAIPTSIIMMTSRSAGPKCQANTNSRSEAQAPPRTCIACQPAVRFRVDETRTGHGLKPT